MEERAVSIWQHQHPFFAEIDFNTINWFRAPFAILFTEDTHDFPFVLPWTCNTSAAPVVCGKIIHDFRKTRLERCQQFKQLANCQHAIKSRLQLWKNKPTHTIAYYHHTLTTCD